MTDYVVAFELAVTVDVEAYSQEEAEMIARQRCVDQGISKRLDDALTSTDFTSSDFYDDVEVDEMNEAQHASRSKSDCVTCTKGFILNFPEDAAVECRAQRGDVVCPYHGGERGYYCGGPQNGQPRPHTACNCTPRTANGELKDSWVDAALALTRLSGDLVDGGVPHDFGLRLLPALLGDESASEAIFDAFATQRVIDARALRAKTHGEAR